MHANTQTEMKAARRLGDSSWYANLGQGKGWGSYANFKSYLLGKPEICNILPALVSAGQCRTHAGISMHTHVWCRTSLDWMQACWWLHC